MVLAMSIAFSGLKVDFFILTQLAPQRAKTLTVTDFSILKNAIGGLHVS